MRKKHIFLLINIVFPLIIGLAIYLICYKSTYINTTFNEIFGFTPPYFYSDNTFYRFISCWACDILWAYSLTFGLYLCFKDFKNPLVISSVLAVSLAVIMEILQAYDLISGTFDIWDIILEITAIILAVIIIKRSF